MIRSTFSGMMRSTAVTWLCWARRVAMERPTYPVPATAMLSGDGEPSLVEEASVNTSEGSNPSTSARFSS